MVLSDRMIGLHLHLVLPDRFIFILSLFGSKHFAIAAGCNVGSHCGDIAAGCYVGVLPCVCFINFSFFRAVTQTRFREEFMETPVKPRLVRWEQGKDGIGTASCAARKVGWSSRADSRFVSTYPPYCLDMWIDRPRTGAVD